MAPSAETQQNNPSGLVSRRSFIAATAGVAAATVIALPILESDAEANVRPRWFPTVRPEHLRPGKLDGRYAKSHRFILARFAKHHCVIAFDTRCTHKGCQINVEPNGIDFHCHCHNSTFDFEGKPIGGPARAALWVRPIRLNGRGIIEVVPTIRMNRGARHTVLMIPRRHRG